MEATQAKAVNPAATPALSVVESHAVDPTVGASAIDFDPTQGLLAVGHENGRIDLRSLRHSASSHMYTGHGNAIAHLKLVPGWPSLVSIDSSGVLRVFDTETLQLCFAYNVPSPPTCLALLSGTCWVLVGTEMGRVYFVNSIEGQKSDFSIGALVQPPSRVVLVEPHPVETEKILVAYAEGTCVVCDLGKASLTEKQMVLSRHRFEHPEALRRRIDGLLLSSDATEATRDHTSNNPTGMGQLEADFGASCHVGFVEPQMVGASWSPNGEQVATVYSNGVVCIFGTSAGPDPIVARTICCEDVRQPSAASDMDRKTRRLKFVRWCTHATLGQSFLVVSSGSALSYQQLLHVFSTGAQGGGIRASGDIVRCDQYDLGASVLALCTVPQISPWRNGCEGLSGLIALVGRPAAAQMLELDQDLRLALRPERLPGELAWSNAPSALVRVSQGGLDPTLLRQLACAYGATNVDCSNLLCRVDDRGILSLWCGSEGKLLPCVGVEFDARYASWLLGIEGHVVSVDHCVPSCLIIFGMSSGEAILCTLQNGLSSCYCPQHFTPSSEIRELASAYYVDEEMAVSESGEDQSASFKDAAVQSVEGSEKRSSEAGAGPGEWQNEASAILQPGENAQVPSAPNRQLGVYQRNRAASLSDRGFIRRSSKRLSSSIGTLFRRGSARPSSTGDSFGGPKSNNPQNQDGLQLGANATSAGGPTSSRFASVCQPVRRMPLDHGTWRAQQLEATTELSRMVYGLQLDMAGQQQASSVGRHAKAALRARVDSGAPAYAEGKHEQQSPLHILPFMLARFFRSEIVNVAAGQDGIVVLAYKRGALVVIDSTRQRVVLADNINQAPNAAQTARDLFLGAQSDQRTATSKQLAEITTASVVRLGRDDKQGLLDSAAFAAKTCLLVGTSQGYVLVYNIADDMALLPEVVERPYAGSVLYTGVWPARAENCSSELDSIDGAQSLVVGSQTAVTVHSGKTLKPTASHVLAARATEYVAVRVVSLAPEWHGVVAVDNHANVTLLSLPSLKTELVAPISGARDLIMSAAVQISDRGLVVLLGPGGVLLRAQIVALPEQQSALVSAERPDRLLFDEHATVPPMPTRRGITSWLLGKTSNASQDIDEFLGSHHRNLLANGATKPGMRLQETLVPGTAAKPEPDQAVQAVGKSVDLDGATEARTMLDERGQRLELIGESAQQMSMQARGFLDDIKAYNAKQEKSSKRRFGLF